MLIFTWLYRFLITPQKLLDNWLAYFSNQSLHTTILRVFFKIINFLHLDQGEGEYEEEEMGEDEDFEEGKNFNFVLRPSVMVNNFTFSYHL